MEEPINFRKLHSDVCEKLVSLCEVWEGKEGIMEEQANDTPNLEDGEGLGGMQNSLSIQLAS